MMMMLLLLKGLVSLLLLLLVLAFSIRWAKKRKVDLGDSQRQVTIGVFHPYCNAGGGGERVLWFVVQGLQRIHGNVRVKIFANRSSGEALAILEKAKTRFGVGDIDSQRLEFVYLEREKFLEAETFPRLTLLGQSLGSMLVGAEALMKGGTPDIFLDTMGYAFTYPLAWLCGSRIACYTHYPTISTDMLQRVYERRPAYNNDELVSGSVMNSYVKYLYYLCFCALYGFVGRFPELVVVNSNWTGNHINQLWSTNATVIFPPCDIEEFIQSQQRKKTRVIVSLGQFRPEKDHRLQIMTIAKLKEIVDKPAKLVCFGSCRDEEDEKRIEELKQFAEKLGVADLVEFSVNVPFPKLKQVLSSSLLGIHTMWNEHFGIAPVEMMAAGIILVAHDSGGPKVDIVKHNHNGFLASSEEQYAEIIKNVLVEFDQDPDSHTLQRLRSNAKESIQRFSQEKFVDQFNSEMTRCFGTNRKSN